MGNALKDRAHCALEVANDDTGFATRSCSSDGGGSVSQRTGSSRKVLASAENASKRFRALGDRYPQLGPLLYISSFQYFFIQFVVSLRWSPPYSLKRDTISDLGNTACGRFNGRYICSPLHTLMNVSFVVLGVTMVAGSVLVWRGLSSARARSLGFAFMGIGGIGVVLVGLFPENSVSALHGIGSALPFLIGNVGVLMLGFSLKLPVVLRLLTLITGAVALTALVFYASTHYLGLGEGGIERLVAYPQTIWLVAFGAYLSIHQARER